MAQAYPTFNAQRAAVVDALLAKGRRGDSLRRLPVYRAPVEERLPRFERTPDADERLTGEGGAELASRLPTYNAARASGQYPTFNAAAAQEVKESGQPMDEEPATSLGYPSTLPVYRKGPAAERLDTLLNTPATDHNGRRRSGARMALVGPTTPTDSLGNAAGQHLANMLMGFLFPKSDEEVGRQRDIARARPAAEREAAEEKRQLDWEDRQSQINYRNSQAEYNRGARADEAAARVEDRRKQRLIGMLRTMPSVDPAKHQRFLDLWERTFGEPFDFQGYNDRKGNLTVRGIVTDPSKPQEKHDVAINFATGEARDLGLSGYVVTRDEQGMSETERRADADRDRGFNALERQRSVSNDLARAGLNLRGQQFDFQKLQRDDRLSEQSRKEIGAAAKLRAEAEQAQMDAEAFKGDGMYKGEDGQMHQSKWAAQRWKAAEDKAEALRREYFQTFGYLHAPDGKDITMTTDEFRQLFPNAPNPQASAPSYGVVLSDSTQPGTPHTNSYPPRRAAPRSPSSASPSSPAPAQPRGRVSRANFDKVRAQNPSLQGKSDAEVEAALRAQGIEVY